MLRLLLIVGNVVAGLVLLGVFTAYALPAFSRPIYDSSLWVWSALFVLGAVLAFFSAAYIGKTKAEGFGRWERFKSAWKSSR